MNQTRYRAGAERQALRAIAAAAVASIVAASTTQAATSSATFTVNANVLAVCSVSATNLNFGDYNAVVGSANNATSALSVTCTNGQGYTIALDAGTSSGAAVNARKMTSGVHTLNYGLYTNSGRSTIWGDGTLSTATVAGTGNGSAQSVTVYAQLPTGQHVADGSYADTITVTLTY